MSNYYVGTTNDKLKSLLSEYKTEFDMVSRASRDAYMRTLGAGAKVPEESRIYGEEFVDRFNGKSDELRGRADEILNGEIEAVKVKKGEAPSTDATNTIMLASVRSNVSKNDVDDLVRSYGENYQAHRAIQDIAEKNNYHIADHPLIERDADLVGLQNTMDKVLSHYNAYEGKASDGYLAMVGMQIDQVFPTA